MQLDGRGRSLDGKALAERVRAEVATLARAFAGKSGCAPGLAVVLVGEDPASQIYTRTKDKHAREVGIRSELVAMPTETTEAELLRVVARLSTDDAVDGILVQLPLPSAIVGRPKAQLLLAADATVTIAHSKTEHLASVCREAELLVVAVGRAELVRGDWIRGGAVVLDVGMNRRDGKLVGDVAFSEAIERASFVTPVPGGVGPMTIASLLENTVKAAVARNAGS
jgi:methylenetetrahydrofolate dehydrogenase (NADP+)/methenyltetrahydrofolate cyclohydrolase